MTWEMKPPFRGKIVRAKYIDPQVETYRGNPFIEALPPILMEQDAVRRMRFDPKYDESYRFEPTEIRLHYLKDVFRYVRPLRCYRELERVISGFIRPMYLSRNPVIPGFVNEFHDRVDKLTEELKTVSQYDLPNESWARLTGFTVLGLSGIGKTKAIESVLHLYPQVIQHREYKDLRVTVDQLVWMKLECPHNGSVKALCLKFFGEIDSILGTSYSKSHGNPRDNEDVLIENMARIALLQGLGILVIDELQHLSVQKSGGVEKMLNFFVGLVNTIGVPVVLIGTPKASRIFNDEFGKTRKVTGFTKDEWYPMVQDDEWEYFLEGLWQYQYTRDETALTKEISEIIFEETQGITDFVVKLFVLSQVRAMDSKTERITPDIIRSAAKDGFIKARPVLNALKLKDYDALERLDDVIIDIRPFIQSALAKCESNNPTITSQYEDDINIKTIIYEITSWLVDGDFSRNIANESALKAINMLGPDTPLPKLKKLASNFAMELSQNIDNLNTAKPEKINKPPGKRSGASKKDKSNCTFTNTPGYEHLEESGLIQTEAI
ncbi:MAG: ATP-binding protein [Firmicutes bacterium]|nr:ATP-binding protein [Bacillota bacterium]